MAETLDAYLFQEGKLIPHSGEGKDELEWGNYLQEQGYAEQEQVWGSYPDVYLKVYEAPHGTDTEFSFVAILNLVAFPHRVLLRDLSDLIQLVNWLHPLFAHHYRPDQATGDALVGSQDAG